MIKVPQLGECGARPKLVGIPWQSEGKAVGGEPIVVEMRQTVQSKRLIRNTQASGFQQSKLIMIGAGWFAHGSPPFSRSDQKKRNLPGAHRGEAWEVLLRKKWQTSGSAQAESCEFASSDPVPMLAKCRDFSVFWAFAIIERVRFEARFSGRFSFPRFFPRAFRIPVEGYPHRRGLRQNCGGS